MLNTQHLKLPVVAAPMFLVCETSLVMYSIDAVVMEFDETDTSKKPIGIGKELLAPEEGAKAWKDRLIGLTVFRAVKARFIYIT